MGDHTCPNCNKKIDIKKYKLFTCTCEHKLLAVQINKELVIQDVTPEYTEFKEKVTRRGQIERD